MPAKDTPEKSKTPPQLPLWKAILLSLVAVGFFFGLLEVILAAAGVKPALVEEDPFVGFASNVPLFVPETGPDGRQWLVTAPNKSLFNAQRFPREKPTGAYRIFCLGGSTTYGRPFDDRTSFAGWLRELLPKVDPGPQWEVINAGGISYASYRVANLMKELVQYEPDLFIIYSGHNEFLEERSYGALRDAPGVVRSVASVLARTRTWTAMHLLLERSGLLSATDFQAGGRDRLSGEVDTLLRRFGPEIYERNDALRAQVLRLYRLSLERMVKIARSVEAEVIFITPASNLKDSSPFKSQHTDGLSAEDRRKAEALLARSLESANEAEWTAALEALDAAVRIDPRHAELHYRRGRALYALGRHADAKAAFIRARDEDVCPLRALSPMRAALSEVARTEESPLVDFIALLEEKLRLESGHTIPGETYFLDHVHPTIEGHRLLAVQLVHEMAGLGIVNSVKSLDDQTIASVSERIEARIDPQMRARSLANLAKVLAWAGKIEDAGRLARQALESGVRDPAIESDSAMIVARQFMMDDRMDRARQYYQKALNAEPRNPEVHFQIGLQAMKRRQPQMETAAGHILFASVFWGGSHRDMLHRLLGRIMAQRRRYKAAYKNVLEARRIDPQDAETKAMLGQLKKILGPRAENLKEPKIALARYPSGNLRRIVQVKPGPNGRFIPDGIWTEWYEGGELKRFVDYADGRPQGVDLTWEPSGRLISED